MSRKPLKELLLSDGEKAAYRIGARNAVKLGQGAISKALEVKGGDQAAVMSAMLNTEPGHALVSGIMGGILTAMPQFQSDARVQTLAEELRVHGMATLGNALVDELTQIVTPTMNAMIAGLPAIAQQTEEEEHEEVVETAFAANG